MVSILEVDRLRVASWGCGWGCQWVRWAVVVGRGGEVVGVVGCFR